MTIEPAKPFYETNRAVSEYLLFHYGKADEQMPHGFGPSSALDYPVRCITECLNTETLPSHSRALDLGCAVGRSTFELARHCSEVIGIDFSHAFIKRANQLKADGTCNYAFAIEGATYQNASADIDPIVDRSRTQFQQGDAMHLPNNLGKFHVILMANLIDRLVDPKLCLNQLPDLVESGGQLIITSPYTWLEEYTPKENWLGVLKKMVKQFTLLMGFNLSYRRALTLSNPKIYHS